MMVTHTYLNQHVPRNRKNDYVSKGVGRSGTVLKHKVRFKSLQDHECKGAYARMLRFTARNTMSIGEKYQELYEHQATKKKMNKARSKFYRECAKIHAKEDREPTEEEKEALKRSIYSSVDVGNTDTALFLKYGGDAIK